MLETTVKFTFHLFSLGIQSQKSSSKSTSLTMKYISQENDNFKANYGISHLGQL